jgi:NADPH2:quinone reductase
MTLVIAQYGQGGPEVMRAEKRDIPLPGAGFVEIAQRAIGFNYFDILQRKGMISDDEPGRVMGIEGAGVVAALGPGVQGFALNDRVGYLRSQGAYAETRLIEAGVLFHLPPDISFDIAAALTVKGFMAWLCACRLFNVRRHWFADHQARHASRSSRDRRGRYRFQVRRGACQRRR